MSIEKSSNSDFKPIYLLADSQLLFWNRLGNRFVTSVREALLVNQATVIRAAYIGASNGDDPEFYHLFTAAMDNIDAHKSKMIKSSFPGEDRRFLESADLILLAGGDFEAGWEKVRETGMAEIISRKYCEGAVILGVSAGALQLGRGSLNTETLNLVPYYISAHDEKDDWMQIRLTLQQKEGLCRGYGIPSGGGLIYHSDSSIEALRFGLKEFQSSFESEDEIFCNLLLPPTVKVVSKEAE